MKKEGKKGWRTTLEYSLAFVWLIAMALGGFFLPGFLNTIPLLKIKDIQVFGTRTISPDVLSSACYQVSKNNWLFLDSGKVLAEVNALTNNSLRHVEVNKELSWNGAKVRITVQERTPIASVVHDNTILLLDDKGEFFHNPAIEDVLPIVYTFSFDYVKKYFSNLKDLIDYIREIKLKIKEIYVTDRSTIAYTSGNRIVLPPLSKLNSYIFDRIKKINKIEKESADVLIISERMAVIRERK